MIKNKFSIGRRRILPAVLSLTIFAAFSTGRAAVYKICAESRAVIEPNCRYASDNTNLFLPVIGGKILSLDKRNLTFFWQAELGGKIVSDVFLKDGFVYAVTRVSVSSTPLIEKEKSSAVVGKEILWQIDAKNGLIFNKINLTETDVYYLNELGHFLTLTDSNGKIVSYNSDLTIGGETRTAVPITVPPLFFAGHSVLISNAKLFAFDSKSKTTALMLEHSSPIKKLEVFADDTLLIGDERGSLTLYDEVRKKQLWKFRTGGQITNLAVIKNREILTASADGFVYLLSKNGGLRWKHRLSERIDGEIFVSGDRVMFGLTGGDSLTVLNLKNGRAADNLPIGGEPHFVNSPSGDAGRFTVFKANGLAVYAENDCS